MSTREKEATLFPEEDVVIENLDLEVKGIDKLIPDLDSMPVTIEPKFLASVRAFGVLEPILLIRQSKGKKYDIAAGRRVAAAKEANRKTIPVRIFPHGWTKTAVLTLIENDARKPNPLSEWKAINSLLEDNHTEAQITEKTGVTPQRMKQLLTLNTLIDPLRAAFEAGTIKSQVALLCAKQKKATQLRLAEILNENGKLKSKDVAAVRRVVRTDAHKNLPASLFGTPTETWHDAALSTLKGLTDRLDGQAPDNIKRAIEKLTKDIGKDKPQEA
jgi:ParB family chromosome partitioning protein